MSRLRTSSAPHCPRPQSRAAPRADGQEPGGAAATARADSDRHPPLPVPRPRGGPGSKADRHHGGEPIRRKRRRRDGFYQATLCAPVNKNGGDPDALNDPNFLVCFRTSEQFGFGTLNVSPQQPVRSLDHAVHEPALHHAVRRALRAVDSPVTLFRPEGAPPPPEPSASSGSGGPPDLPHAHVRHRLVHRRSA